MQQEKKQKKQQNFLYLSEIKCKADQGIFDNYFRKRSITYIIDFFIKEITYQKQVSKTNKRILDSFKDMAEKMGKVIFHLEMAIRRKQIVDA